jgi:hypothetical protein
MIVVPVDQLSVLHSLQSFFFFILILSSLSLGLLILSCLFHLTLTLDM